MLPQYSGGLGILAGDHLKAASDLGVPLIGVGLLYRAGYFAQGLSADGWQLEHYPSLDPHGLPLKLLRQADGSAVVITVPLPEGRTLHAHVWRAQVGRVSLLLLDSDIEENAPTERGVTDRLYGGDEDHRLRQEMLLGIGGVRAVRAYCGLTGTPAPEVFHANEGHAGFQGVERIRELTEAHGLSFAEALQAVRAGTVFTTHTPVPAGIDRFPKALIERYFAGFGVPLHELLALGAEEDPTKFNMAHMGLRLGQRANGVSQLHGHVSRGHVQRPVAGLRRGRRPDRLDHQRRARPDVDRPRAGRDGHPDLEPGRPGRRSTATCTSTASTRSRRPTCGRIRRTLRGAAGRGGAPPDPRDRALPRRHRGRGRLDRRPRSTPTSSPSASPGGCPSYKRLTLMLRDPERLKALLLDPERPIQLVIAGKSHPADDGGKQLIQQMVAFADDPEIRHRIAFLPGYDIGMARYLYWGCDVWLNNPLRPLEACGTSGMKAALNGGLNLSIRDGWWDEWFDGQNGWAIPTADGVADPDRRDEVEARAIYDLLEQPGACRGSTSRTRDGVPARWVEMVRHTLRETGPEGARHPHGPRLRAGAVRAGRRLRPGDGRRTATPRRARRRPGAAHLLQQLARRAGGARRGDRRRRHPGDRVDARPARRGRAARAGPGRRRGPGGLRPGRRRRRAAPGDHRADGARAHRRLAALVHRDRSRSSGPAPSVTRCACSRTPSAWPTRPSSGW